MGKKPATTLPFKGRKPTQPLKGRKPAKGR